ncbi:hypothetical protein BDC45DRAFT_572989 [Circinella umbellata]|nr:hypothetical protein BDC45DRAFT_572989 [Circinella umbellata]
MKVLYFAAVRDITQVESDDIQVSPNNTDPWTLTNKEDESKTQLSQNDEIAIIPPVSGG